MSLNRISYLESWVYNSGASRHQHDHSGPSTDSDGDDDAAYQDLPDDSISSFPSTLSYPPLRHRLGSNPVTGLDVTDARDDQLDDAGIREETYPETVDPALEGPTWLLSDTTGAFEVERWKRIAQVCVAVIYCFLASGIIFGFAAIKPVLIKEGVYRDLCSEEEIHQGVSVCYGQEIRLNLMFTIGAVATNVSALPVGTILDAYGPRVCGIVGGCLLAIGALILAFAAHVSAEFDAYIISYLLLALGGPFLYISSFHLSNTFPARSGLILATINGAFDASCALFLIFRLIHEKTGGWLSTQRFALVYLATPLFIIAAQVYIMPSTSYKTVGELVQQAEAHIAAETSDRVHEDVRDREGERQLNDHRAHRQDVVSKIQDLLVEAPVVRNTIFDQDNLDDANTMNRSSQQSSPNPNNTNKHTGGIWGTLHGLSALHQIRSPWFILITLFTILQILRLNYFVASIRHQYEHLLSSPHLARQLNETFDVLLPVGGVLAVPLVGAILDNTSTRLVLVALVTTATFIGVLGCIPYSLAAGYANIALFVVYCPFYYSAIPDYAAKVFGFQSFGKVYGLMIFLAGLGNFAQTGLDALTFKVFDQNPIPVNVILTATTGCVGVLLVGLVWRAQSVTATGVDDRMEDGCMLSFHENDGVYARDLEQEPLLYRPHGSQYGTGAP